MINWATRSTGTVHTSVKGQWRNDVIIAAQSSFPYLVIRKTTPVSRRWSGSPPKFNQLFIGPSSKMTCKFVWKLLRKVANKQTDKQTDRQTPTKTYPLLGGGNKAPHKCPSSNITRHRASTSMYSLTFRVRHCRRYAVMCIDCQYARRYVVIATNPVHRSQVRPLVHN